MFEHYIFQGSEKLRCGYTTGTCAAIAAGAAVRMLLGREELRSGSLVTPKGLEVTSEIEDVRHDGSGVSCAVRKDGGDDIDATDGILIYARAEKASSGIEIDGGEGVGRVTKPGLDQPVGAAAINSVPRRMITEEVRRACEEWGYAGGMKITVFVPEGKATAEKTFNPNLGIVGGISILGTSGIVEPKSLDALRNSVFVEMRVRWEEDPENLIITPGNYGEDFIARYPKLRGVGVVKCANFIGDSLDCAARLGFKKVLLVGHIGKFVKLAGGIMNTHSRTADCRSEIIAAYSALAGAGRETVKQIMRSVTTDECVSVLERAGLRETVMASLVERAQYHAERRAAGAFETGVVMFSNVHGVLGVSEKAEEIISVMSSERNDRV